MILDYIKLKEVKPVLAEYVTDSIAMLDKPPAPDDKEVHDIRVLMKKARAAIKLLASHMSGEDFEREYFAFRAAGRTLASWRDSSVHRKTLKAIRKSHYELFRILSNNQKLQALMEKPAVQPAISDEIKSRLEYISGLLKKSSYRIRFLSLEKLDPQLLIRELEKSYKLVSGIYLGCRNNPRPGKIHEFRKKSKDFLYQLQFFRPLNPAVIKNLEKRLEQIASNLGKYNDLTQILRSIGYKSGNPENTPELDELAVIIKGMQDQYLLKVWPAAYKIFCPGQQLLNVLGFKLLVI